jgi:hypothetical protein
LISGLSLGSFLEHPRLSQGSMYIRSLTGNADDT